MMRGAWVLAELGGVSSLALFVESVGDSEVEVISMMTKLKLASDEARLRRQYAKQIDTQAQGQSNT